MKKKSTKDHTVEVEHFSLISDFDIHLFKEGKHYKLYEKLGAHAVKHKNQEGVFFAVWAPNAKSVSLLGNFNHWKEDANALQPRWDGSGIWEGFFSGIHRGEAYKYGIRSQSGDYFEKADPFAAYAEIPPQTASIVWDPEYLWKDEEWLTNRKENKQRPQPMSVYEVHLGSWKRKGNHDSLSYQDATRDLVNYVKEMGFTHVEFLPIMEHPFYGSWGYQITGYYAPTSRYGCPEDFKFLVDRFHQEGIGVILDWVPSHFPGDAHGLFYFDGTHLYEHADPRKGFHPDWKSYIFNLGRNEVRSFLLSNAMFWVDQYHIDGLRVDAVASMLYLDYSRKEGEWIPNIYGGRENIEAIQFLKEFNVALYENFPDTITIAEESTSWPGVSRPTYIGGLGFGQKWMMGWMHDTLQYFMHDPVHRKFHQNEITFSILYAFTENFMLPLSHDEVVHGKGSILGRMPGDEWRKFANLRLLYAYMYTHPGTKLLFMGNEFGQSGEWNHDRSLDWHLLDYPLHQGVKKLLMDLNSWYKQEAILFHHSFDSRGFSWIDYSDRENSVVAFERRGKEKEDVMIVVCNFTPEPRPQYRLGVSHRGYWKEVFNSDLQQYGGSGVVNAGRIPTMPVKYHGQDNSIALTLPPLGLVACKWEGGDFEFELLE